MGGQIISSRTTNAFHIRTTHHDPVFFIFIISDLQITGDRKSAHERQNQILHVLRDFGTFGKIRF